MALVSELKTVLETDACASFKHTIPAECTTETEKDTDITSAYKKTRNVDPLSLVTSSQLVVMLI